MSSKVKVKAALAAVGFLSCVSFANAGSAQGYNQSTNESDPQKWIETSNKDKSGASKASLKVHYQNAQGNNAANHFVSLAKMASM